MLFDINVTSLEIANRQPREFVSVTLPDRSVTVRIWADECVVRPIARRYGLMQPLPLFASFYRGGEHIDTFRPDEWYLLSIVID